MKKRIFAMLLALCMVISLLAGCSPKEEADAPAQQENAEAGKPAESGSAEEDLYVIQMMVDTVNADSTLDSRIGQYIADEFGIAFEYVGYPGEIQEQQALMLAGGDFNEIQYMQYENMVQQYIDAGALINLDDYKELLPDFYERYEDLIPYWRSSAKDGGLYKWESGTPKTFRDFFDHHDVMVRADVLEYYGYPELVTASDWIAFLEQAIKDFPTTPDGQATVGMTMPMAESWGMQGCVPVGYEKGEKYVSAGNDYFTYNTVTGQFEEYLTDEAKESFQFFNEMYQKGILDEECFTDSSDMTAQKMNDGRAIAVWYQSWSAKAANTALTDAGHPEMHYIELPFQLDSQNGQPYSTPAIVSHPYSSFGVTTNCKDVERVLKFINWCCTEEGQLILQAGLEGVHYTVENGQRVPTELRKQMSQDNNLALAEGILDKSYIFQGMPFVYSESESGQAYNFADSQAYKDEISLSDTQKKAYAGLGWAASNEWWAENGKIVDCGYFKSCALDTTSDLGKVGAKMTEVRVKYSANLIMADDFEGVWNEMMAEYNKLDHEAVIDAMNAKLAEYMANMK